MKVTQCDRCKKIVEHEIRVAVHDSPKAVQIAREYDLCESCGRELEQFLKGEWSGGGEMNE